jgi:hypothetical protein
MSRADAAEAKKAHALASLPLERMSLSYTHLCPIPIISTRADPHARLSAQAWWAVSPLLAAPLFRAFGRQDTVARRATGRLADQYDDHVVIPPQHPIKQVVQLAEIKKFEEIDLKSIKTFQIVTEKKTFVMRTEV